jgi:hypothetical protein
VAAFGGFERKLDQIYVALKRKVERGEFDEMINSLDKFALKMTLERLNDKVS